MAALEAVPPFKVFSDRAGNPLEAGYIYIGTVNLNPQTNPIVVYWDSDLTIPATQPIRTLGGYPSRQGSPAQLFVNAASYSITVRDKRFTLVYTSLENTDFAISFEGSLAGPNGSSQVGWARSTLSDDVTNVHQALDSQPVSIWEHEEAIISKPNPADPNTWDWSPALNAALAVMGKVRLPGGFTYRLKDIRLYSGCEVVLDKSTIVAPVEGSSRIFYCDDNVITARHFSVTGGRVENPSLVSGVTVFDLPQARRGVVIQDIYINGGGRALGWVAVSWPKLNWMSRTLGVQVEACATGFRFRNAAAVMDLIQCVALDCGIGFDLAFTVGDLDILNRIRIQGGVCQSSDIGIKLRSTDAVIIDGVHFENNTFDIDSDGDKNTMILYPEMRGNNSGLSSVGIKLRNTLGTTIYKPITAGVRQAGFFQVDTSNYLASLDIDIRLDAPTLNSTMLSVPGDLSGLIYVQNIANFRSGSGGLIDFNSPISTYQKSVPDLGITITGSSEVEGREAMITVRPNSSYTTGPIIVLGYSVDVSGGTAIRNKNKTLHFIYRASAGGWVVISESGWI